MNRALRVEMTLLLNVILVVVMSAVLVLVLPG